MQKNNVQKSVVKEGKDPLSMKKTLKDSNNDDSTNFNTDKKYVQLFGKSNNNNNNNLNTVGNNINIKFQEKDLKSYVDKNLIDNPNNNNNINNLKEIKASNNAHIDSNNNNSSSSYNKIANNSTESKEINSKYSLLNILDISQIEDKIIENDKVIDYEKAYYLKEHPDYIGDIYLTNYQLKFNFKNIKINTKKQEYRIEKNSDKNCYDKYTLEITLYNNTKLKFIILSSQLKFYSSLVSMLYPKDFTELISRAKNYHINFLDPNKNSNSSSICNYENNEELDGWMLYNAKQEYERMGAFENNKLRITISNKNFYFSKTYPEFLMVPSCVEDNTIIECSTFRTKSRFPTLSYVNKKYKGSLWRSSQPKSGLTNNRNTADEIVIKSIASITNKFIVYDARPYLSAMGNRVKGGGSEVVENYNKIKLIYCDIENIHNVSKSFQSICSINRSQDNRKYLKDIEESKWLDYIHLLLKYSKEIAINFTKSFAMLIHCSDGWDRSSQLLALSMIIIDSYYRTAKGFAILIEKEFLSFGHQFGKRSGIIFKKDEAEQKSPIFIQFLDCIYQLICQFPQAFEFNELLLLFLADRYYSLNYGTFMFDNDLSRKENKAKQFTRSIWSDVFYILDNDEESNQFNYVEIKSKFKNKLFDYLKYHDLEILPNHGLNCIEVWENYFFPCGNLLNKLNNGLFFDELYCNNSNNANNSIYSIYNNNNKNKFNLIEAYETQLSKINNSKSVISNNLTSNSESNNIYNKITYDCTNYKNTKEKNYVVDANNYNEEGLNINEEKECKEENTLENNKTSNNKEFEEVEETNSLDENNFQDELNQLKETNALLETKLEKYKTDFLEMKLLINMIAKKSNFLNEKELNIESTEDNSIVKLLNKYILTNEDL